MNLVKKWLGIVAGLMVSACIEPYPIPQIKDHAQYLVVDGFLDATNQKITVKLSRSVNLNESGNFNAETSATVYLENENQLKVLLNESSDGVYERFLTVDPADKYRLRIQLTSGKKYFSDLVEVKQTPPIDSLNFFPSLSGLQIRAYSHDPKNKTHYYFWKYEETYEYTSAYHSSYTVQNKVLLYRNEDIYHCWTSNTNTEIVLTSTKSLKEDVVSGFAIVTLPKNSVKTKRKYSILVKQMALEQKAYEHWQLLKKNTESLGTLFDPQPSQLTGNIYSETENGETVLGYFMGSTVAQKRFTFGLYDLPRDYQLNRDFGACELFIIPARDVTTINEKSNLIITALPSPSPTPSEYYYSTTNCADCRLQGGTTNRPPYW